MQLRVGVVVILMTLALSGCGSQPKRNTMVVPNYVSSIPEDVRIDKKAKINSTEWREVFEWLSDSLRFNEFDPCNQTYLSSVDWIKLSEEYTYDEFKSYFLKHAEKTVRYELDLKEFLAFYGLINKVQHDGRLRIPLLKSYDKKIPEEVQDLYNVSDLLLSCRRLPQFSGCMKKSDCYIDLYFDPGTTDLRRIDIGKM